MTGSLNASLALWLIGTGRLEAPYVARQGTVLGRAGRVHVDRDADGTTWIGGGTVTCMSGTIASSPERPASASSRRAPGALLERREPHAAQHRGSLRELDVAVVDDLHAVAPRVAEVEAAAREDRDAGASSAAPRGLAVVDDEAEMALGVGRRPRPRRA